MSEKIFMRRGAAAHVCAAAPLFGRACRYCHFSSFFARNSCISCSVFFQFLHEQSELRLFFIFIGLRLPAVVRGRVIYRLKRPNLLR